MRCPDCAKFVSFDEPEAELQTEEVRIEVGTPDPEDDQTKRVLDFVFESDVRVALKCGECGTELKEGNFSMEITHSHTCDRAPSLAELETEIDAPEDVEFEVEAFDRMQDRDRHGNIIKNRRYMKHLYGAELTGHARCPYCKVRIEAHTRDEMSSSEFDELV